MTLGPMVFVNIPVVTKGISTGYRSGPVNLKSFVSTIFLQIKVEI